MSEFEESVEVDKELDDSCSTHFEFKLSANWISTSSYIRLTMLALNLLAR